METIESLDRKYSVQGKKIPSWDELVEIFEGDTPEHVAQADWDNSVNILRRKLLESQGVTNENLHLINVLNNVYGEVGEKLALFEPFGLEADLEELKSKFHHLEFMTVGDWSWFKRDMYQLVGLPFELLCAEQNAKNPGTLTHDEDGNEFWLDENGDEKVWHLGNHQQQKEDYKKYLERTVQQCSPNGSPFDFSILSDNVVQLILDLGNCYRYITDPIFEYHYKDGQAMTRAEYELCRKKKYFGLLLMLAVMHSVARCSMTSSRSKAFQDISDELLTELKIANEMVQGFADDLGRNLQPKGDGTFSNFFLATKDSDPEKCEENARRRSARMLGGHGFIDA